MNSKYEFTRDWFSNREQNWLKHFAPLSGQPLRALEIGSLEGRSAVWMLDNMLTHPQSQLYCIDIFRNQEIESRFDRNIYATGCVSKVTKIKGQSWLHLRNLPCDTFDLVYIDGSHHGRDVIEDAVLSYRLLRNDGFLVFDDYPWRGDAQHSVFPKDAIDAFLHLYQEHVKVIEFGWQVILRRIR